jgi:hypothetical protein
MYTLLYTILFVFSFIFSYLLSILGLSIIFKCKTNQQNGQIRNIEDKFKDNKEEIWFWINLSLTSVIIIATFTAIEIFKKNNTPDLSRVFSKNTILYSLISLLILNAITGSCGWDLTSRCDGDSLISDTSHLHKRELFVTTTILSFGFLIIVICN